MSDSRSQPGRPTLVGPAGPTSAQPSGVPLGQPRPIAVFHQTRRVTYRWNDSEVAAWYTDIAVPPGDYPLLGWVEHGRADRCGARLPGVIAHEYHGALWGGVPLGSAHTPRDVGQPAVYPLSVDGSDLAGLLAERDGRGQQGWFELTDPALEVRSREMLTAGWRAHTWSYCQTCGDYMGPIPAEGTVPAGFREQLFRAQEQRHQADSGCERPYMLHAGGGFVPTVGQWHQLVERDYHDPFMIVYLAAGQSFQTLAEAFEASPTDRSITERLIYPDGRSVQDRILPPNSGPIIPLPAQFVDRHQAALEELRGMTTDLGARPAVDDDANALEP